MSKPTVFNHLKTVVGPTLRNLAQQSFVKERKRVKHNILAWFTTVIEDVLQISHFLLNIAELIYKYCFNAWYFICAFGTYYSSAK